MSQITKGYPSRALLVICHDISLTGIIILHNRTKVIFYNCMKLYQYRFNVKKELHLQEVWRDSQTCQRTR